MSREIRYTNVFVRIGDHYNDLSLDDLLDIQRSDPLSFSSQYVNNLFCPSCKEAKLTWKVGAINKPHLALHVSYLHNKDCEYENPIPVKKIEKYIKEKSPEEILHMLKKMINNHHGQKENALLNNIDGQKPVLVQKREASLNVSSSKTSIRIPQKQIGKNKKETFEGGVYKIYYGIVKLKILNSEDYFNLQLINKDNNNIICSIGISKKYKNREPSLVWKYTQNNVETLEEGIYTIAFLGKVKNVKGFNNTYLERSQYLTLEKIG